MPLGTNLTDVSGLGNVILRLLGSAAPAGKILTRLLRRRLAIKIACQILFSVVVLIQELILDTFQLCSWQDPQQLPSDIQSLFYIAVCGITL